MGTVLQSRVTDWLYVTIDNYIHNIHALIPIARFPSVPDEIETV